MTFNLGKPILVMLVLSALSAAVGMLGWHEEQEADLTVWIAAEPHARSYREGDLQTGTPSLAELFEQQTGMSVNIDLISGRALNIRLLSMFMSDARGEQLPDLVELEINSVGMYFRPPVHEVGLLPLNDLLERDGLMDEVVRSRFAPWTKDGVIFGVPHDVHPVGITYRKDLFDEAGIDLDSAETWQEFHDLCLEFQNYWRQRGVRGRYAIELPAATASYVIVMLLQRGVNILDDRNQVHINDPIVAETIAFYAQMVRGPKRIAAEATPGGVLWVRDMVNGDICAFITPDWRVSYIRSYGTELEGRVRFRDLPKFDPSDPPTSTWGGTMAGIPRNAKDVDASWELLKTLYFGPPALEARLRHTAILPASRSDWDAPIFHEPDPFFGGQYLNRDLIELADQIPPRYVTPFTLMGTQALGTVLHRAIGQLENHGPGGLEEACQRWLDQAAVDLERRIEFGKFE